MKLVIETQAKQKIATHLDEHKRLLLTFEDGVGAYSQHAMIHMQVQFTLNVVTNDMPVEGYQAIVHSNLGDILIKDYSAADLEENMVLKYNSHLGTFQLSGDGGLIDGNVGFIDFTDKDGRKHNPAR
ncbi:iron-sulfur cluster biosynthesis family protein [Pediococcus siamensis]|uniref:iron-sulfur cluster biosynthesis family protein n=1 Tax=Pediococcus siamensis TaxID=381829 RepID=UPI0039A386A3